MASRKGVPNKAAAGLKAMASIYTKDALETLVKVMKFSKIEGNRVAAANSILDRAHGKPTQAVSGDPENPVAHTLKISWEN